MSLPDNRIAGGIMPERDEDKQQEQMEVDRLSKRLGKYGLVMALTKRAQYLKQRMVKLPESVPPDVVGQALDDIAEGKVKLDLTSEEEEQESSG